MTRHRLRLKLMAAFFALLALSAFSQSIPSLFQPDRDPMSLAILQLCVGVAALLTAVGSWRGATWASWGAVAYGLITGAMVASLGPILDLPADARPGLVGSGVLILAIGLACAWYLRRATARPESAP